MFHLFAEAADAIEIPACGDVGILVLRHGFSYASSFPPANWRVPLTLSAMDLAMSSGWVACLVAEFCARCRFPDNRGTDATRDKNGSNAGKAHSGLRYSQKGYLSDIGKSNVGL